MLQQRLDIFRNILKEKSLDGFLVSNFYNIFYLSGFKTLVDDEREAWLLVTANNSYIFTDSRYQNLKAQILKLITPEKGLIKHLREIITEEKIKTLGIEGDDLKLNEYQKLKEYLSVKIASTEKLIIRQRATKDDEEIRKIKKACEISDRCFEETIKTVETGVGEKELYRKMELWLRENDYDMAFDPIIAVDENSALMHYDTKSGKDTKIKNGSIILFDFGAKCANYTSDTTRVVFFGKPEDEMLKTYDQLLGAQEKTIQQLCKSQYYKEVDKYCREQLNNYSSLFSYAHSTGHGVGLEIHEYPKISFLSEEKILSNQVVTIEPGIYLPGKWGMRIEDTVLINKQDAAEVLTKFSKQPLFL